MTARRPCPLAPGPLEEYAAEFEPLFRAFAQRRGFREYLAGLLQPRDRDKTQTALAGAESIVEAPTAAVQRLQFLLSEAAWNAAAVNAHRVALRASDPGRRRTRAACWCDRTPATSKDGTATTHVARQYRRSVGKNDNGIVAVTSLWADERVYHPLGVEPYTPACRLPEGKQDRAFHTKPEVALALIERARAAGIPFRAVVADCFYGGDDALEGTLLTRRIPHVLARRGHVGRVWAPADEAHSFDDAARELARGRVGARGAPVPRRPNRDVVGGRAHLRRLRPREIEVGARRGGND
jgi:SRSO17 transposase